MEAMMEKQRLGEFQKKIENFEPYIDINDIPDRTLTKIIETINSLGEYNLFDDEILD